MARASVLSAETVLKAVQGAGLAGLTADDLSVAFPSVSRSTLNRRLRELAVVGDITVLGNGPATRYVAQASHSIADIRRYLSADWQARHPARYREELLEAAPLFAPEKAWRLSNLQALSRPLDSKFLSDFLIDFSWASSVLEGSTYSVLDTQALLEYGQRNAEKPVEDAVLALNHKNAIQHLWANRDLTVANLCRIQALLTDRHDLAELAESGHFLPDAQRGTPREYEEVRLGRSAYSPPFRPGTGYVAQAFERIVATARTLDPVPAAFYLITRIPYLQAFVNGNKRTSRLAANLPLIGAGMLPLSFVDFNKPDYISGMAAFYELGDAQLIAHMFAEGYVRSIVRGSDIPAGVRIAGFSIEEVSQELARYVHAGQLPNGRTGLLFLKTRAVGP